MIITNLYFLALSQKKVFFDNGINYKLQKNVVIVILTNFLEYTVIGIL